MAEQQLVEYIKKAKAAGQSDNQTRALLYRNGWTESEVAEAFAAIEAAPTQPRAEAQPRAQIEKPVQEIQRVRTNIISQPAVETPSERPVVASNFPEMKTRSHFVSKLLLVLIILLVLGGTGYFVVAQYLDMSWNPFAPNPRIVIGKMFEKMREVKAYHLIAQGEIAFSGNNSPQTNITFQLNGGTDLYDEKNPKSDLAFLLAVNAPGQTLENASLSTNIISVDGASYLKINDNTFPSNFLAFGLDLTQLRGKYLKLDGNSLMSLSQIGTSKFVPGGVQQTSNSDAVKKIQELFLSENLFSFEKDMGSENVNGQSTHHYLISITKDRLKKLLNDALEINAQGTRTNNNELVKNVATSFLETVAEAVGDIDIELWIGKEDYLLYAIKIDKTVDLKKIAPNSGTMTIKFDETNSDFGKTLSVQAPANSQNIEDVLAPAIKLQKVSYDMNLIGSIANAVLTTSQSYASLCYNYLLNGYLPNYGTTLISLNKDIIAQGAARPLCLSSASNFCVSAQLPGGKFVCAGKNGIGSTRCLSAQTACK